MKNIAVPKIWLFVCALVTCLSCLPVALRIPNSYRYADWSIIDRVIQDSLLFSLPVATLVGVVTAHTYVRDELPWFSCQYSRARQSAARVISAVALAASAGMLVGMAPVAVWGFSSSTSGGPSVLGLLGILIWIGSACTLSAGITVAFRSVWPGLLLAVLWPVLFEYGRTSGADNVGRIASTHMAALPVDGIAGGVATPYAQSTLLEIMRLGSGLGALFVGILLARRAMGVERRSKRVKALAAPSCITLAAVIAGTSVSAVPIAVRKNPDMDCLSTPVKTCLYRAHSTDLPALSQVVGNLRKNVPEIFDPREVTENDAASAADVVVTAYPESESDATSGFAQQITATLVDPRRCYAATRNLDFRAPILLERWLYAQATSAPPDTSKLGAGDAALLHKWSQNRSHVNEVLGKAWPQVQNCKTLPKELLH